jgi:hypothetical protein
MAFKTSKPGDIVICSVMSSATRSNFHIRLLPMGGRESSGKTLCGLPAQSDYHFGMRAWGQEELGTWCDQCLSLYEGRENKSE